MPTHAHADQKSIFRRDALQDLAELRFHSFGSEMYLPKATETEVNVPRDDLPPRPWRPPGNMRIASLTTRPSSLFRPSVPGASSPLLCLSQRMTSSRRKP